MFKGKPGQVLLHVTLCLAFLSFPFLMAPDFSVSEHLLLNPHMQCDLLSYALTLVFFYLNYLYFIPAYFDKGKKTAFLSFTAVFFVLVVILPVMLFEFNHSDIFRTPGSAEAHGMVRRKPRVVFEFIQNLFLFLVAFFVSFTLGMRNRLKQVEKERLSAELSYLKAQINPHFLFNTLNSIYSLAIQRSDETAAAVVKLSAMMRYITTDTHRDFVPLEKELEYIRSYIELQRLRLGDTVRVEYRREGPVFDQEITPLVLITFVENAFKYGVNPEEESHILIDIRTGRKELEMVVKNNKVRVDFSEESRSGLGIKNARKRLALVYPGKHSLNIEEKGKEYIVSLKISMI